MLSISGGKDSTAMYLQALEWGNPFEAVFADVGNEHDLTLEYVDKLAERTGGPVVRVVRRTFTDAEFAKKRDTVRTKWAEQGVGADIIERALKVLHPSGNQFLDACLLMSGFPYIRTRFCTDKLKIQPILEQAYRPVWARGEDITSWQGVRSEESRARSGLPMFEGKRYPHQPKDRRVVIFRPLIHWTIADVWAKHRKHGLKPNPLYSMGANRVGCYPCIFSRKAELRQIAELHPEHIDRIAEWERLVTEASKHTADNQATFFPGKRVGEPPYHLETHGIWNQVRWANTSHGGKQIDFIPPPTVADYPCDDDTRFLGLCE